MSTELERRLIDAFREDAQHARLVNPDRPAVHVGDGEDAPQFQHRSRRWMQVAAATIAVVGLGLLAVTAVREPASVQTDAVPTAPASSINPVPTAPLLPVDSMPATLPADTTPAPTTPAPGKEISVAPGYIQFGDRLVGVGSVAKADGRTYVGAGHFDVVDPYADTDQDLVWFRPETSVLAAFDEGGVEVWRTELDWTPGDMVVVGDDLWVARRGGNRTLERIDASDGRVLGQSNIRDIDSMVWAFGSLWVTTTEPSGVGVGAGQLVRIDPDLSTDGVKLDSVVTLDFDECVLPDEGGYCPNGPAAGADAMWLPLGPGGVARIDPDTNQATVIPVDDIGHEVLWAAADGDVAYVAYLNQVTSIVDGEVVATVNPGQVSYLGPMDGAFGVLNKAGSFRVLEANDPMVVTTRQISTDGHTSGVFELNGEAWVETGKNYNPLRIEFLPASTEGQG